MRGKRFGSFLLLQGLQSASSLVAMVLLASTLSASEFGILTLALAVQWFALGAYDALVLTPATIAWSKYKNISFTRYLQSIESTKLIIKYCTAFLPSLCLAAFSQLLDIKQNVAELCLAITISSVAVLTREESRLKLIFSNNIRKAIHLELANTFLFLVLLALFLSSSSITAFLAILIWTAPLFLSLIQPRKAFPKLNARAMKSAGVWVKRNYKSLLAAKVTWMQSQGYVFLCAALLGSSVLGNISAIRILFTPLQTLYTSAAKAIMPEMARHAHERQYEKATSLLLKLGGGYLFTALLWTSLIFTALNTPLISSSLPLTYLNTTTPVIWLWSIAFLVSGLRFFLTTLLKGFSDFDHLLRQGIYAIVVLTIFAFPLTRMLGPSGAIAMLIGAESFALIFATARYYWLQK